MFLVQTVARQSVEHCQYRPPRIREDRNRKATNTEGMFTLVSHFNHGITLKHALQKHSPVGSLVDSDMPDHDLEPPRFAQLALERVLQDWNALKSMIMFGSQENKDP